MNKKLIINADDFGQNADISNAIIDLAAKKGITSTTVMANSDFPMYMEKLEASGLGIGLHLNLIEGKPLSEPATVFSLINEQGNFKNWQQLFTGFISGKVNKSHIEIEIASQIEFLESFGIQISHIDSHKHIHQYPILGTFILSVLKRKGITKIRNCSPTSINSIQMKSIKVFSRLTKSSLLGFRTPDRLFSFFSTHITGDYSDFISSLKTEFKKHDCIEIMAHPSFENNQYSYLNRKAEYLFLSKVKALIDKELQSVQLISYNQL